MEKPISPLIDSNERALALQRYMNGAISTTAQNSCFDQVEEFKKLQLQYRFTSSELKTAYQQRMRDISSDVRMTMTDEDYKSLYENANNPSKLRELLLDSSKICEDVDRYRDGVSDG